MIEQNRIIEIGVADQFIEGFLDMMRRQLNDKIVEAKEELERKRANF